MNNLCPDNEHPLPIAEAWDQTEWVVDLAIRKEAQGLDIEATASDPTLTVARHKAYVRLKKSKTIFELYGFIPN